MRSFTSRFPTPARRADVSDFGRLLMGGFSTAEDAVRFATEVAKVSANDVAAAWPAARDAFVQSRAPTTQAALPVSESTRAAVEERMANALFQSSIRDRRWKLVTLP